MPNQSNDILFTCLDGVNIIDKNQTIFYLDEYQSTGNVLICPYQHLLNVYDNKIPDFKIYGKKENAMEYLKTKYNA